MGLLGLFCTPAGIIGITAEEPLQRELGKVVDVDEAIARDVGRERWAALKDGKRRVAKIAGARIVGVAEPNPHLG